MGSRVYGRLVLPGLALLIIGGLCFSFLFHEPTVLIRESLIRESPSSLVWPVKELPETKTAASSAQSGDALVLRQLRELNETLYDKKLTLAEHKIRALLNHDMSAHAIAARWPLPKLPLVLSLKEGNECLVGAHVCEKAKNGRWNVDQHVRDIVISVLLEHSLPWGPKEPCIVHDIGANVGLITQTFAKLGCHVIALEPQVDLLVASRLTLESQGQLSKHVLLSGGIGSVAGERLETRTNLYRYEGGVPAATAALYPVDVPMYTVKQLAGPFERLRFAKIDTDWYDCMVLEEYLTLIEAKKLKVDTLILETWDNSCGNGKIAHLLFRYMKLGYFVYRTLTPRDFDDDGIDTRNHFKPVENLQPPKSKDQYHQRIMRHVWKLEARSEQEWKEMIEIKEQAGQIYFLTKVEIYEQGFEAK